MRPLALVEAAVVTFLWSTSYVLIKIGLAGINPLAFAAYRYIIASMILIVFLLGIYRRKDVAIRPAFSQSLFFLFLGFTGFLVAQGFQFIGLYYLTAITVTFILNMTPIMVVVIGVYAIKEVPSRAQLGGIALTLAGVIVFFYGETLTSSDWVGIIITFISGIGWALYMIYSRSYLRSRKDEDVVVLSVHSMMYGSLMLMALAGLKGELIYPSIDVWIIILWLAVVNTAIAFVVWNHALRWLKAYEQSVLQNTMLIQITLLAYVFLGERLSIMNVIGMATFGES